MENGEGTSRQNLTVEEPGGGIKKKRFFVSLPMALFFVTIFVAAIIAVVLIISFAIPRKKCPVPTTEELKTSCRTILSQVGKEEFCGKEPEPVVDEKAKKAEEERAAKAALRTGLRLNKTLIPSHYELSLWPRFYEGDNFTFTGNVTISFNCTKDTDVIVLHVSMLTVDEGSIVLKDSSGAMKKLNGTDEDLPRQFYKIYPAEPLKQNTLYTLYMSFNGTLIHDDWRGLYRSSYKENNVTHWLVSTQFEMTDARRAFPCFDESFFKATFSVTIIRKVGYTALSNMRAINTMEWEGADWKADVFERSERMTPYLLAIVVSQFVYVERRTNRNTITRVYTRPSYIKYAEYANDITYIILDAFERWTGIQYSLRKLDQVAVPDFAFGAMENWGLIIYRETALLYNPDYTTTNAKRYVGYVIAHELAHQWFGNLVTCRWWDDTFLNEAFATYFGYFVGLKAAEPTWKVEEFFVRVMQGIMDYDGSHTSQPIRVSGLEHHDELLKAFNRITYSKGGSILRMIREFLGPGTFQRGLQRYLNRYAYQTVVAQDLYRALQEQADLDGSVTWDTQKTDLAGILRTWIDQQNFPLLHATDLADGSLKVTQSHFLYDREQNVSHPTPLGSEFLWDIPLTYTDDTLQTNFTWMLREKEIRLSGLKRGGWKFLNPGLTGFYRVRYGDENWNQLLYQLMQNHTVFPVENRAGFIDDAFQIAKAGQMEEVDALRSTEYLQYEREYLPWYPGVSGRVNYYLEMFYGKDAFGHLEKYLMNLVLPMYNISGWTVPNDPGILLDKFTRNIVIRTACEMNYKPCVDQAQSLYEQFMNNPNINPIAPDLRAVVYCVGVARGGVREWEFMRAQYQRDYGDIYIAYENYTVADGLACATTPNIVRKYLDYAMAYNSTAMFIAIAGKRAARDTVWNYITERWQDFMDGNETIISKSAILKAVTSGWNTDGDLRKLRDFMSAHDEKDLAETYKSIKETILDNKDWLETNMAPIENWLRAVNSGQSYKRMTSRRRRRRSAAPDVFENDVSPYDVHNLRSE